MSKSNNSERMKVFNIEQIEELTAFLQERITDYYELKNDKAIPHNRRSWPYPTS